MSEQRGEAMEKGTMRVTVRVEIEGVAAYERTLDAYLGPASDTEYDLNARKAIAVASESVGTAIRAVHGATPEGWSSARWSVADVPARR